ncbi:MAG: hypothetical protein Q7R51_00275 [bacterium]|nr:hypothetical protein [bacterium]
MKYQRINAIILRHLYNFKHSLDRLSDSFYWPAMDLILWGLTSIYIRNSSSNVPFIVLAIITGLIFWQSVWRSQYEITVNFITEIWDRNLVNIFASPITIAEWITSVMILGIIKMSLSLSFAIILAIILYQTSIFSFGLILIPFFISLLMTGWAAGFIVAGLIARYGIKIQTLAWVGVTIIMPFSAVFYPVSILPIWAQKIAMLTPTSYIFEGMREILFTGKLSYEKLFISFGLNTVYLILAISFFIFMFNKSRKLGLGRLI